MSRAFINHQGFTIAKPGYDANTAASRDLMFTPNGSVMAIYATGIVSLGLGDFFYKWGHIYYGRTFSVPPLVLVAGQQTNGAWDINLFTSQANHSDGTFYIHPGYSVITYHDHCVVRIKRMNQEGTEGNGQFGIGCLGGSGAGNVRYFILENTV